MKRDLVSPPLGVKVEWICLALWRQAAHSCRWRTRSTNDRKVHLASRGPHFKGSERGKFELKPLFSSDPKYMVEVLRMHLSKVLPALVKLSSL